MTGDRAIIEGEGGDGIHLPPRAHDQAILWEEQAVGDSNRLDDFEHELDGLHNEASRVGRGAPNVSRNQSSCQKSVH
jgi:hypothetical protein